MSQFKRLIHMCRWCESSLLMVQMSSTNIFIYYGIANPTHIAQGQWEGISLYCITSCKQSLVISVCHTFSLPFLKSHFNLISIWDRSRGVVIFQEKLPFFGIFSMIGWWELWKCNGIGWSFDGYRESLQMQ